MNEWINKGWLQNNNNTIIIVPLRFKKLAIIIIVEIEVIIVENSIKTYFVMYIIGINYNWIPYIHTAIV